MRRTLPVIAILAVALLAPSAAPAASVGISDQQARVFSDPLFAPLKFKEARYITPYDVIGDPSEEPKLAAWIAAATAARQKILVSFEHSRRSTSRARKMPTVSSYKAALKRFKAKYPKVKEISPWNEANRCQIAGSIEGQPTCRSPKRVAQYYMAARKLFRGSTIVGVDILDQNDVNPSIRFLKDFLRYASPDPKVIGLHNYSDTNRFSTSRTRKVLQTFKGKVWLTETGGIVRLGTSFKNSPSRAAKALGCMFAIGKAYPRIQRLYVYQFHAGPANTRFDAGLVDLQNKPRPGYAVVRSRKSRTCRA
jgi:hypothetical protein